MIWLGSPGDEGPVFDHPRRVEGGKTPVLQRGPGPASRSLLAGRPLVPTGPGAGGPHCFSQDGRRLYRVAARRAGGRWRDPAPSGPDFLAGPLAFVDREPGRAPARLPYFPRTLALTSHFTRLAPSPTVECLDLRRRASHDALEVLRPRGERGGVTRERPLPLQCLLPPREERRCRRAWPGALAGRGTAVLPAPDLPTLPVSRSLAPLAGPRFGDAVPRPAGPRASDSIPGGSWARRPLPPQARVGGPSIKILAVAAGRLCPCDDTTTLIKPVFWAKRDRPPGSEPRLTQDLAGRSDRPFRRAGRPTAPGAGREDGAADAQPAGAFGVGLADHLAEPPLAAPAACRLPPRVALPCRPPLSGWPVQRPARREDAEAWAWPPTAMAAVTRSPRLYPGQVRPKPALPRWPSLPPGLPLADPAPRPLALSDRVGGSPLAWAPGIIPARFMIRFPSGAWRALRTIRLSRQALRDRTGRPEPRLDLRPLVPEPGAVRRCRDHAATIVAHAPTTLKDYAPTYRLPREAGDRARLPAGGLGVWARPPRPLTAAITQRMGWPAGPRGPTVQAAWAWRPRRLVFLPLQGTAWPGTRPPPPALLLPDRQSAPAPSSWRGSLVPHVGPIPAWFGIQPGLFHDTIDLLLRSTPFTLLALLEPFNDIHDPPPPRRQPLKNPRYLQGPGFMLPRRRDSLRQYRLSFPTQSPRFLPPARGPRIKLAVRRRPWPASFSPGRSVFPAAGWRADGPLERPFVRGFHEAIAGRLAWHPPAAAFHLLDQPLGRPPSELDRKTGPASAPPPATASSGEPRPTPIPAVAAPPGAAGQAARQASAPTRWTSGRGLRALHLQARLPDPAPRVAEPAFLPPPPWTIDHRLLAPAVGFGPFPFGFPRPLERPSRFWLLHAPPDLALHDRGGLVDWPRPYLFTRHLRLRGATNLRAPRRFLAPELRVGVHFPFGMPFGPARGQPLVTLMPRRPHFLQELSNSPLPPLRHWREPASQRLPSTWQRPMEPPRMLRPGTVPYHHPSAPLPEPGLGPTPRNWPPSANVRATQSWLRAPLPFPRAELPPGQTPTDRPLAGQLRSGLDRRPNTVWELPPRPAPPALRLTFHRLAARFLPERLRPAASDFPMVCRSQPTTFWTEVAPPFLPHLPWLQLLGEPTLSDDGEGDDVRLLQISVSPTLPVLTIAFPAASRPVHPWNPDHSIPGDIPSDRARRVLSFADRLLPDPVGPKQEERRAPLPWSRLVPERLPGLPDPEVPLHRRVLLRLASRFASGAATEVGPRLPLPPPPPATWMTEVRLPPILHASAPHWTITPGLSANLQIVPDQRSGLSVTLAGHDRRPTVGVRPVDRRPLAPIPSKRHQASRLPVLFRTRRPTFSIRSGPPAFPPVVLRWPRWSSTDRPLPGDYLVRPLPTPPFVRPGWTFLLFLAPPSPLPALGSEPPAPHLFPTLPITLQPLEQKRQAVAGPRTFRQRTAIEAALAPRLPSLPDWMELPGHAPGDQIRLRFPIHL